MHRNWGASPRADDLPLQMAKMAVRESPRIR